MVKRIVEMRSNDDAKVISEVPYDRLVIGVGALTNTFHVPGADKHAFFLKVKSGSIVFSGFRNFKSREKSRLFGNPSRNFLKNFQNFPKNFPKISIFFEKFQKISSFGLR